jgi:hypothetical protein
MPRNDDSKRSYRVSLENGLVTGLRKFGASASVDTGVRIPRHVIPGREGEARNEPGIPSLNAVSPTSGFRGHVAAARLMPRNDDCKRGCRVSLENGLAVELD